MRFACAIYIRLPLRSGNLLETTESRRSVVFAIVPARMLRGVEDPTSSLRKVEIDEEAEAVDLLDRKLCVEELAATLLLLVLIKPMPRGSDELLLRVTPR